jgi:hypothetical protein
LDEQVRANPEGAYDYEGIGLSLMTTAMGADEPQP